MRSPAHSRRATAEARFAPPWLLQGPWVRVLYIQSCIVHSELGTNIQYMVVVIVSFTVTRGDSDAVIGPDSSLGFLTTLLPVPVGVQSGRQKHTSYFNRNNLAWEIGYRD